MSYQGHAGQGGLQNHSVGGCYPFTVFGKGDPTSYGVLNAATGEETAPVFTARAAWDLAEAFKRGALSDLSNFDGQLRYLTLREWTAAYAETFGAPVPDECSAIDTGVDQ